MQFMDEKAFSQSLFTVALLGCRKSETVARPCLRAVI
jgi:hypothetical protein